MNRSLLSVTAAAAVVLLGGCTTPRPPIPTVVHVDLRRFMGDWYVIAATPTFLDKNAYNASARSGQQRALGYDVTKLRLYPQRWPAKR